MNGRRPNVSSTATETKNETVKRRETVTEIGTGTEIETGTGTVVIAIEIVIGTETEIETGTEAGIGIETGVVEGIATEVSVSVLGLMILLTEEETTSGPNILMTVNVVGTSLRMTASSPSMSYMKSKYVKIAFLSANVKSSIVSIDDDSISSQNDIHQKYKTGLLSVDIKRDCALGVWELYCI